MEGKRLKLFRKTFGITQQDMAYTTGRTKGIISRYESGDVTLPIEFIKLLHKHYQLNYEWIFEGVGKMKVDLEENKRTLVTDIKEVISDVDALKTKVEAMDKILKDVHTKFYADRYSKP